MSETVTKEAPKVEAAQAATFQANDPLAGIVVKTPETNLAKTRRYFAGIKKMPDKSLDRFQLRVGVGSVVFSSQTFAWKGKGDLAEQVFRAGAVCDLTDDQVREVREKLRYLYLRLAKAEDEDGQEFITGLQIIDASDSGSITKNPDGSINKHPVHEKMGILRGDEIPLVNILSFVPAASIEEFDGQVMTLEQARKIVAEAEAEEAKLLQDPVGYMESGKGGLLEKKAGKSKESAQEAKRLRGLASTDGSKKAEGGYLAD